MFVSGVRIWIFVDYSSFFLKHMHAGIHTQGSFRAKSLKLQTLHVLYFAVIGLFNPNHNIVYNFGSIYCLPENSPLYIVNL